MRQQSRHSAADRGDEAYFTPAAAVYSLLALEGEHLPRRIWEPAAGDGAISRILLAAGYDVVSTDLCDYGWDGCHSGVDYLKAPAIQNIEAIITNAPFSLTLAFARKALREVSYVALLQRLSWLESEERLPFFRAHGPTRIWISSRRLPMMHRPKLVGEKVELERSLRVVHLAARRTAATSRLVRLEATHAGRTCALPLFAEAAE
jgi:hypothetical protein